MSHSQSLFGQLTTGASYSDVPDSTTDNRSEDAKRPLAPAAEQPGGTLSEAGSARKRPRRAGRKLIDYIPERGAPLTEQELQRLIAGLKQKTATKEDFRAAASRVHTLGTSESTYKAQRTAARSWSRYFEYMGEVDEILEPLTEADRQKARDELDAILMFTQVRIGGKNPKLKGMGLASTVGKYTRTCLRLHHHCGVDLSYLVPHVASWEKGMRSSFTSTFGVISKMKKGGFTKAMMKGILEQDWAAEGDPNRVLMLQTAAMVAFVGMFRRSEYTGSQDRFNPKTAMNRGSVEWFHLGNPDHEDHTPIQPWNEEAARGLKGSKQGYAKLTPGISKCDPEGEWQMYPILLRLTTDDSAIIRAGDYFLDYELAVPIFEQEEREATPLFTDPKTASTAHPHGKQLGTVTFDKVIKRMLSLWFASQGQPMTDAQISRLYSLHSFRIGGLNALQAAGVPREIRLLLGRWKSAAMDGYTRQEVEMCLGYLASMDTDCKLYTPLSRDMPRHEGSEEVEVGDTFDVNVALKQPDQAPEEGEPLPKRLPLPSLEDLQRYFAMMRKRGRQSNRVLQRQHPLMGRQLEMSFWVQPDGPYEYYTGKVVRVDEEGEKPVHVKYQDETVQHELSVVLDALDDVEELENEEEESEEDE